MKVTEGFILGRNAMRSRDPVGHSEGLGWGEKSVHSRTSVEPLGNPETASWEGLESSLKQG